MHEALAQRINQMKPLLNEKQMRRYLGSEAESLGYGGIAIVSKISGKARNTIVAGIKENNAPTPTNNSDRVRRAGGGRKCVKEKYPGIMQEIESIISDTSFGNPENPLSQGYRI